MSDSNHSRPSPQRPSVMTVRESVASGGYLRAQAFQKLFSEITDETKRKKAHQAIPVVVLLFQPARSA